MSIEQRSVFLVTAVLIVAAAASQQHCGITATIPNEYVAHGHSSLLGQWPWHGALFHRVNRAAPTYACGTTVVSNFYTLTAAHCTFPSSKVRELKPNELLIRLGIANLEQVEHSQQQFTVKEIVRHEDFDSVSVANDIALLKVSNEIEFNAYVRPICFWKGDASVSAIVGKKGYSPGWGMDERGNFARDLKHAVMPITSREKCRQSDPEYYTRYLYDRKAFCAGSRNGTTVGNGDSGGGLYIQVHNVWYLRGIVSNGKLSSVNQLDANSFVVYTDVAYYLPWLQHTLDLTISDEKYAECGLRNENPPHRLHSDRRPWPWHGEVYRNGSKAQWLGDVAIINRNFVLSQGGIFTSLEYKDPSRLMVVFKAVRNYVEKTLLQVQVKVIISYKKRESPRNENNIVLMELVKPLIFTESIRPICLWRGDPAFTVINGTSVYIGRAKSIPLPGKDCARVANSTDAISNSLCFGATKEEHVRMLSSIMFLQYDGKWYARGISYKSAKSGRIYLIYLLDVALYTEWIEKSIAERSEMLLPVNNCLTKSTQEWNVRIKISSNDCYGSLITSYLILTTALCLSNINHLDQTSVILISNSEKTQAVNVIELLKHPYFHEDHLTHNIALIHIKESFGAEPICISKKPSYSEELFFTSWQSKTELNQLNQSLTLTNMTDCNKEWRRQEVYVNLEGGHICGQLNQSDNQFDCKGDLYGSPLSYERDGKHYLQGILDFGKSDHCALGGLPEGFINVTFYSSWIYETFEKIRNDRTRLAIQDSQDDETNLTEDFNLIPATLWPKLGEFGIQMKTILKEDGMRDLVKAVKDVLGKAK